MKPTEARGFKILALKADLSNDMAEMYTLCTYIYTTWPYFTTYRGP